ncbi:TetR/AcrR family transcriptional regulator [Streptomyces sp. NPDC088097]
MAAARELAAEEGWEAVSMRRLADRIGYSANYAYRYFQGRDDILLALVRDGFVRLAAAMRASGSTVGSVSAAYLDFALDEPDLYQVMYGLGGARVSFADIATEGAAVAAVVAGALGSDDPDDDRVTRIWATAHGLAALYGIGKLETDRERLHRLLAASAEDLLRTPKHPHGGTR